VGQDVYPILGNSKRVEKIAKRSDPVDLSNRDQFLAVLGLKLDGLINVFLNQLFQKRNQFLAST